MKPAFRNSKKTGFAFVFFAKRAIAAALDLKRIDRQGGRNDPRYMASVAAKMASLTIPAEALPDLTKIAELEDTVFSSLLSAIRQSAPALTRRQFEERVAAKIKLPNEGDLKAILRTAFVLYLLKEKSEISSEELTEAVVNAPELLNHEEFPAEKKEFLRSRLKTLLDLDQPLGITAKALDVMTENERIFCSARILSDIRPVFSERSGEASAAVIIHNLQIGFHMSGKHHEFYFALDTNDIQKLKTVVERAEKKTVMLQSILKKAEVPYLEA